MKLSKSKFLIALLLIIGGVIFYISNGTPWDSIKYKNMFESYLEEKYHKDFVIDEISYDVIHDTYHSKAYEISNPKLKFYVGQNMGNKKITDAYHFENIALEAQKEISSILDQYIEYTKINVDLINLKEVEINVWTDKKINDDLKKLIKSKIASKGYTTSQLYFNR